MFMTFHVVFFFFRKLSTVWSLDAEQFNQEDRMLLSLDYKMMLFLEYKLFISF